MAAAGSGLRSPDDTPNPPRGTAPGPATLAGMAGDEGGPEATPPPPPGQQGGGAMGMLGTALNTLQQAEITMTQMARQFPAASPSLLDAQKGIRQGVDGIRAALRQIMTSPGQPEPPAPTIGG